MAFILTGTAIRVAVANGRTAIIYAPAISHYLAASRDSGSSLRSTRYRGRFYNASLLSVASAVINIIFCRRVACSGRFRTVICLVTPGSPRSALRLYIIFAAAAPPAALITSVRSTVVITFTVILL